MISDNLKKVQANILAACNRSNRDKNDVTLICVSKTKPVEAIYEAMDCGYKVFGENKVQEMCSKYEEINDSNLEWHLIGHLQTNKVKYIVDKAALIHSVDSLHLATTISKEAVKHNVVVNVLIEVNVAKEDTKFGVSVEECEELIIEISKLPNIIVKGLMTIAPFVTNPEENRIHFANLRKLLIDINNKNIDNVFMNVLSMGMTNDYEVAIEEGATHIRVGTGIFGDRQYHR